MELSTWAGLRRWRRPRLQAGRRVRGADRRAPRPAAGALREGAGSYERPRQRRVLGVRRRCRGHLHDPHARAAARVRIRRAAQLRPRRVHGDRRLHDGDPRREGGLEHVARRAARRPCRGARRRTARARDAASAGRLLRDRHDRLQRDRPLRRDERGPPDRRLAGHDHPRRVGEAAQYNGQWQRFQAVVQGRLHVGSKRRRDARDRLGGRRRAARARLAGGAHALGPRAARDPRGRGRGRLARQERLRATSSRRLRSAPRSPASPDSSTRGSSRSSAPTTSSRC